jgi:hypothetical protein
MWRQAFQSWRDRWTGDGPRPSAASTSSSTKRASRTGKLPRAAQRMSESPPATDSRVTHFGRAADVVPISIRSGRTTRSASNGARSAGRQTLSDRLDRIARDLAGQAKRLVDRGLETEAHDLYLVAGELAELAERAAREDW